MAPPVFSGRNVTIKMKNYKWSNGSRVTANDVMFWINMDRAVPQDWFDYSPGGFPSNVSDIKVVNSTTLTMTMNKAYSPTWFQYNQLSQITPMPAAWDRTASGPGNCDTTVSDCAAVYKYLSGQANDLDTYATNPLWSTTGTCPRRMRPPSRRTPPPVRTRWPRRATRCLRCTRGATTSLC